MTPSLAEVEAPARPEPVVGSALIEIRNVEKIYDNGVHALKGVSFEVKRGEFLGVIGLSGSGKSTLLRCINRLVEPTGGEIVFDGVAMTRLSARQLRDQRRRIGMIFQHFNLIPRASVLTNVLSGRLGVSSTLRSVLGLYDEADKARARALLKVVGLEDKVSARADRLSGGQQQRVAIARSLMQDPEVLLADEPVASLDPATSHSVMQHLERANKELGKTIVCNLHFLSLVRQYTTRVVALKGGEKVFEGDSQDIDEDWFKRIYGEDAKEIDID
jgi:phosphonate transport system ATP-binding protein